MFRRQQLDAGQQLLFDGLKELGIILKPQYSDEEVQQGYEETRQVRWHSIQRNDLDVDFIC
jgi:hypothetical protein